MISTQPFNTKIMDVDEFINNHRCMPVTSHQTFEASSTKMHPEGLFSEEIFGEIGSEYRLINFGYIDLHTTVFHPQIFLNIIGMKGLYKDIMASKTYAYFDPEEKELVACNRDVLEAGTGFAFFMEHFPKIEFKKTNSLTREIKIRIFEKYKDKLTISKCLVLPAGVRDVQIDSDGRPSSEDINKLYNGLLAMSLAIPPNMGNHPIFNSIRFNIQMKVYEIYLYIKNILQGKRGFGPGKYMARKLALGTRNVFASAQLEGESPNDPKYLKHDETLVPLFQALKMFQPIIQYYLRFFFYNHVFDTGTNKVALLNPGNFNLEYVEVTDIEKNKFLTDDGLDLLIERFLDEEKREDPVIITGSDKKEYYVALIFDKDDKIYITRNADEFVERWNEENPDNTITKRELRPLTMIEMMYLTAYPVLKDKYMLNTRYPVTHIESIYPSKVHLATTRPSRSIEFHSLDNEGGILLPEYPILGNQHVDAIAIHHSWLKNLGADFDGDMGNGTGILSKNANEELKKYMEDPKSMVNTLGELIAGVHNSTLIPYVFFNMSRRRQKMDIDLSKFRPSLSRIKHIRTYLDTMPIHECILIGSSFLAMLGLTTNDDIDVVTTEHIWNIIGKSPKFSYDVKKDEYHTEKHEISVFNNLLNYTYDDLASDMITIESVNFIHPKVMVEFYQKRNMPKDKERIALYKKYLSEYLV